MKITTIYRENKLTGDVEKIEVTRTVLKPSYESEIDLPMHQRILNIYRDLEARGKLGPNDCEGGKTFTKRVHEEALAKESQ